MSQQLWFLIGKTLAIVSLIPEFHSGNPHKGKRELTLDTIKLSSDLNIHVTGRTPTSRIYVQKMPISKKKKRAAEMAL